VNHDNPEETGQSSIRFFTVETVSLSEAPIAVYTFLEQVAHGLLDHMPLHFHVDEQAPADIAHLSRHVSIEALEIQEHELAHNDEHALPQPYRRLIQVGEQREEFRGPYTLAYLGSGPSFEIYDTATRVPQDRTVFGRVVIGRHAVDELLAAHHDSKYRHQDNEESDHGKFRISSRIEAAVFVPDLTDSAMEQYHQVVEESREGGH
jgi:hypothetical protein